MENSCCQLVANSQELQNEKDIDILKYLPVVAKTSGSEGLKRTEITVSDPQEKLFTGSDLITCAKLVSYWSSNTIRLNTCSFKEESEWESKPIMIPNIYLCTSGCKKVSSPLMINCSAQNSTIIYFNEKQHNNDNTKDTLAISGCGNIKKRTLSKKEMDLKAFFPTWTAIGWENDKNKSSQYLVVNDVL